MLYFRVSYITILAIQPITSDSLWQREREINLHALITHNSWMDLQYMALLLANVA
jgi:hypothetical protein